jgi:hypothetical protein
MSKDKGGKREVKKPKQKKASKAPNSTTSDYSKPADSK